MYVCIFVCVYRFHRTPIILALSAIVTQRDQNRRFASKTTNNNQVNKTNPGKPVKSYKNSVSYRLRAFVLGVSAGKCVCREGFAGQQCDRCAFGYRDFPQCAKCECNLSGSINNDPCAPCICKVSSDVWVTCSKSSITRLIAT